MPGLAMPQPTSGPDRDEDGWPDSEDNCRDVGNPDQTDADRDGYGSLCDGDFNNNGVVGATDFLILRQAFSTQAGSPGFDARADLNLDGAITALDWLLWLPTFGRPAGPSGLACAGTVPCPN